MARLDTARHSRDVDVFFSAINAEVDAAADSLSAALRINLGDHFTFDITRIAPLQEDAKGACVHVNARLGPTSFAAFHIDVVVGTAMTGTPDIVPPLTPLEIDGLVRPPYRVFPIVDHLADKLCAILGTYTRGGQPTNSTQVKDLVDIAIIATTQNHQRQRATNRRHHQCGIVQTRTPQTLSGARPDRLGRTLLPRFSRRTWPRP